MNSNNTENDSSLTVRLFFVTSEGKFCNIQFDHRLIVAGIRCRLGDLLLQLNSTESMELSHEHKEKLCDFISLVTKGFCDSLRKLDLDALTEHYVRFYAETRVGVRKANVSNMMSWISSIDCTLKAEPKEGGEEVKLHRTSMDLRF